MSDPLDICARFLEVEGAAVDRTPGGIEAVVPERIVTALGLPDEFVRLADAPGDGGGFVAAGYGSALLERVAGLATAGVPVARADVLGAAADKAVGARALERFDFLNAAVTSGAEAESKGLDRAWWFRYAIEADERVEGLFVVGTSAQDAPLRGLAEALADPRRLVEPRDPASFPSTAGSLVAAWPVAASESLARLSAPLTTFIRAVGRRHARDRRRIETYYRDLIAEMRRDLARRVLSPEGVARREAKIEATARDRLAKLADLDDKYAVRVSLTLAAVLCLRVPRRSCDLTVRRRSQQFHFPVVYDGFVQDFDPVTCQCCGASTYAVGFCDEALHALCRSCLGRTGGAGRRGCPACAGEQPEEPQARLRREFLTIARREGFPVEGEPAPPSRDSQVGGRPAEAGAAVSRRGRD